MKAKKLPPIIPSELVIALGKNKKAKFVFEKYPPSHKLEYIEWIEEAKKSETRADRIKKTIKMIIKEN